MITPRAKSAHGRKGTWEVYEVVRGTCETVMPRGCSIRYERVRPLMQLLFLLAGISPPKLKVASAAPGSSVFFGVNIGGGLPRHKAAILS